MKRTIIVVGLVTAVGAVNAQITVNINGIVTLGDTVLLWEDTTHASGLDLGAAAGNQTWDFTSLEEQKPDGAILEDPSTAPLSSSFPNATFVVNDLVEDSIHIFFQRTSTYYDVVGMVSYNNGVPEAMDFGYWRYMEFPATMGDNFMSTAYSGMQVDSIGIDPDSLGPHPTIDSLRSKFYIETHSEIDAWGELELPQGTFLTVRQKIWNRLKIVGDWYGNGQWRPYSESFILAFLDSVTYDTNNEATYRWWSDNIVANFWVAEVYADSADNAEGDVSYLRAEPAPAGIKQPGQPGFEVYPNPSADFITIESDSHTDWQINLYDIAAKKVLNQQVYGTRHTLDVSGLTSGAYLMQVTDGNGRVLKMHKVQVTH